MNKEEINKINSKVNLSPGAVATGDKWLLDNGIITDVTHNNIILNLYMTFKRAKYVEYYLNMQEQSIEIHFKFSKFWNWWYTEEKLRDKAVHLLSGYLNNFTVTVKKGVINA